MKTPIYLATSKTYGINEYNEDRNLLTERHSWAEDLVITEKDYDEWLLESIPVEFRGPLSYMAYEDGHHAGEDEVNSILRSLIHDLRPAIEAYTKRILA